MTENRINEELEYISNPDFYIKVHSKARNKDILMPLADYLEREAGSVGFDSYREMLEEGYSVNYKSDIVDKDGKCMNTEREDDYEME